MATTDNHDEAKQRYQAARDAFSDTRKRMIEDLKFSNPADPQQWDERVRMIRELEGRPCLTFDQTNQYIAQVVNDSRQNKPGIKVMPADSKGDPDVAEHLEGIIRHIEYRSRAGIAYDTAQEYAARIGLGWLRVSPKVIDPETNLQEIDIQRVHNPLSVVLNDGWTQPDGSDATEGWITSVITRAEHEKRWPGKPIESWNSEFAPGKDNVVICEHFEVIETSKNMIVTEDENGDDEHMSEDDYWQRSQEQGVTLPQKNTYSAIVRTQKWCWMNGAGVLEETEFPSPYVPLIPVIGYEVWIEDKRYLCGLSRRMRDSQTAYNYERSSYIEQVALQPKAPFLAAWESIEQFEGEWQTANVGNKAYLPYNSRDEQGEPLPVPQRQNPPPIPAAFAQGSQLALNDIQASIGMYRANLGAPSNETSGRAINARQREGDTANFHYIDNLSRSIEHLGRIIVGMIPKIYDTKRIAKILGDDGSNKHVTVDPKLTDEMGQPAPIAKKNGKVVAINPSVGSYDVRVKVGPGYTTLREEAATSLGEILKGNPQLVPVLGPMWARMQDWPEAEKVSRMLLAMAPPAVQEIEHGGSDIPPEAQAQISQLKQTLQQLEQAFHKADEVAQGKQVDTQLKMMELQIKKQDSDTKRLEVEGNLALQAQQQTATPQEMMARFDGIEHMLLDVMRNSGHLDGVQPQQAEPMQEPPPQPQPTPNEPPQGGFFTPEQ